ncbi:hypothetical protein ABPG74_013304 [Tetrahymena malaccensis]
MTMFDEEAEYLKRYYNISEYPKKSKLLTEYYKFHKDIPRLFMLPETYILNNFHDKKRRFDYYRIAQLIEEENKKNPDRPPKGIVGEKPPLRTNESSEDKQDQIQQQQQLQKQTEQSQELLLGDISSFINRGQCRDDQMIIEQDLIANSNTEDLELTDRFVQYLNFQKSSGGPINSVSSLNSLKVYQKNNNSREEKSSKNLQANQLLNQKGKQIFIQQYAQQQPQGSSSQLQQLEISANAFLNYQKKLEQYKNSQKKENEQQISNAKQNIPSQSNTKQQQSSQQYMIQEKNKKKTNRTDASLTIHELNQKLEEIVTSHSLISSHIVDDEARQQFDYRELDQFLKFLNQKEKENQFTVNPNKIQFNYQAPNQQQNPQTLSLNDFQKQTGAKDIQHLLNTKDINLTNKNIQINNKNEKKSSNPNIQNLQTQQLLLQQAIQHNKQSILQNPQILNDTSRNNFPASNNPNSQQQIIQNQLAQLQQNSSSTQKKVKVKPSKSEIINMEQLKNNNLFSNDMQILALNEMNIDNYVPQLQQNQQIQCQQVANYLKNNNQINQNQSKKRLTPQLRLDDIEYFNDNKLVAGKPSNQQQHAGSVSVKFSHRDSLNSQQTQNCIRSARDQYPTTTTNKFNLNIKSSCDSKLSGFQIQQSSQTTKSSSSAQFQIPTNNQIHKDSLITSSLTKQQQGQYNFNQQSQFQSSNSTKNHFPNSISSISVANKLDTKESQLFTPRQPQIQPCIVASSIQKNLNKGSQTLPNKPPLSPRDSLPSPKNSNQVQSENILNNVNSYNIQSQETLQQNQMNTIFNQASLDQQNLICKSFSTKNSTAAKKKQQSQQLHSQNIQMQYNHNNSNSNQGNNNSITGSNQVSQSLPQGSFLNQQQNISSSQLMLKKGNMKHLNLKLKLDQLNFSKEKTCHNDNVSTNQIIKEPLSQRSCSSKNIDLQTPKYNLYEMFKQQISNQAYASAILKSDPVSQKQQNNKNMNSQSSQNAMLNQAIPQQQKSVAFQSELQNPINKQDQNKNLISSAHTASVNDQTKQQKQQQIQNLINQNQYQPFLLSPQQQKTTIESFTQQSPTQQSNNNIVKVLLNFNNPQINNLVQSQQAGQTTSVQQQNSNNNSSNLNANINTNNNTNINSNQNAGGAARTTTNSTNRKGGATFIHINSSGNNIQINSPKQQLEQQKKVISQQTTRSEANTRKNSQVKTAIEKSHHSTVTNSNAAIPAANSMNVNSKHVSRNSSLEINNNPNVLRKKSPQLFKYQQKETKNVYNLVQQLSNNLTQQTPKQTVSARNYQTQRNSINNFDFQKPEITSHGSQNQLSIIQQSTYIQSPSYNNSVNNQQMAQGKQQIVQFFDPESASEQIIQMQQNTPSNSNQIQNNLKNNNINSSQATQNATNNQLQFCLTPNASNLSQSVIQQLPQYQNFQNQKVQSQNLLQFNNINNVASNGQQAVQQSKMIQSAISNSNSQQQKVSSPQIKKVANMHKHTKSENLMNLIIETNNTQSLNQQQSQIPQTPQNQINAQPAIQTTIKKGHKNQIQALSLMNNPIIPSNAILIGSSSIQTPSAANYQQQQFQNHNQYQSISSSQLSPRVVLNQNFQQSNEKQLTSQQLQQHQQLMINQQSVNNNNNNNQFLNKKQSLASPLSSRSTQMNFQVELFRSTNNSTNNNNSNTNNTNSQHNNYPNSGVNNNSSSMNSQLNNNNNVNNNSNNSTTQQVNSSLNANNNYPTGSTSTNTNTFNQLNYVGFTSPQNASACNPQQLANTILQQNNIQKKGSFVQSQINGFFSMQSNNIKQNPTSSTVTTCNSNTNIISNNLLKTTQDNSLQAANISKKTKKKSMF